MDRDSSRPAPMRKARRLYLPGSVRTAARFIRAEHIAVEGEVVVPVRFSPERQPAA